MWITNEASLEAKTSLLIAVPENLDLWNSETWSGSKTSLAKLDVFRRKSIRRILWIRIKEVEEERMPIRKLRMQFGGTK